MLNQKFAQITYPKRQSSCHGEHGKNQTVDLIHSVYDFKHFICDSIQSFVKWMTENTLFYGIYGNGRKNQHIGAERT